MRVSLACRGAEVSQGPPTVDTLYGVEMHSGKVGEAPVGNDGHWLDAGRKKLGRLRDLSE